MELLINAIMASAGGSVASGIFLLVLKVMLKRMEIRESKRDGLIEKLDGEVKSLKNKEISEIKDKVEKHHNVNLEHTKLQEDFKKLASTVERHIDNDNGKVFNERLGNIEGSIKTLVNEVKSLTKECASFSYIKGATQQQDAKLDMISEQLSRQSAEIKSNREFLNNLNEDYQTHRREDHRAK